MNNVNNVNKILAIVASGFPGGQKIIIATAIFYLFDAEYLGEFSVLIAIPSIVVMFTAIGLGAKLMVVIPGSDIKQRRLNSIMMVGLAYVAVSILIFIGISLLVNIKTSLLSFSSYLLFLTMYQIFRHFLMAERRYYRVLFLDSVITIINVGSLFLALDVENYVVYSSTFSMLFIMILYFTFCKDYSFNREYLLESQSLQFSLNTALSGGVSASFPLVIDLLFGTSTTGRVVLALSYFSLLQLLSRSYINYVMPDLVKLHNKTAMSLSVLSAIRKDYFKIMGGVAFVSIFVPILYFYSMPQEESLAVIYAVLVFSLSGSLAVVEGVFLFIVSRQIFNIYSNLLYVFLFLLVCILSHSYSIQLLWFLILSSVVSFLRWPYLYYIVKRSF
ncbi:MAG: hypothetical protein ACI910_000402 [Oleispira sp.]|jgi:hypothetical protein